MHRRRESLGTAAISDALDRLGIAGQALGIAPLAPSFTLWGPAYTVRYVPATGRGGTVGDFIDDVDQGSVVVLDNGGRVDVTVWGDLLTTAAVRRGIGGTVVHGACRDTGRIRELDYPVFSCGFCMRTGKDRVSAEAMQEVVSVGTASVEPGDLVVGDGDGVVVVPQSRVSVVLELAHQIESVEAGVREAVEAGEALRDARCAAGYHRLQRAEGRE